ncbi:MAG: hypothetical protein IPN34_07410 [Planctomycetes bacterium]|nr:hypothetical protein [Planctomycetota bacterium]
MQNPLTLPISCDSFAAIERLLREQAEAASVPRRDEQRLLLAADEIWRRLFEPTAEAVEPAPEVEVCVDCGAQNFSVHITDDFDEDAWALEEGPTLDFVRACVDEMSFDEDVLGGRCVSLRVRW